jgi:hypothetical protein
MKYGHSLNRGRRWPEERKGARTVRPTGSPDAFTDNFAAQRMGDARTERQRERFIHRFHFDNGAPHRFGWGIDNAY